jgi:hypothetical protein
LQIRGTWSAGPGDDQARFLADLRALRDVAAIGFDELAARAHYPSDILKEAENGPLLPGLPVLTAYVRACEGDVLDWEERWRRLAEVPEDPSLPVRPPGASPAAVAGARAGVGVSPPEVYDPERIRAALRGGRSRPEGNRKTSNRGAPASTMSSDASDFSSAGWDTDTSRDTGAKQAAGTNLDTNSGWNTNLGWDAVADQTITTANGNHSAKHRNRAPFGAADGPDTDESADADDQFRWLPENESALPTADPGQADPEQTDPEQADKWQTDSWQTDGWQADTEQADKWHADTEQADTEQADSWQADSWQADTEQADSWQVVPLADTGVTPGESAASEWAPPQHDDAPKPPERTDFWATSRTATDVAPTASEWAPPQHDDAPKPPERTDFWATSATKAPAEPQLPAAATRQVEKEEFTQGSWSASTETTAAPATAKLPQRFPLTPTSSAGTATATQPRTSAEPARATAEPARTTAAATAPAISTKPAARQKDRFFLVRLLVIVVIAALIGSALVLLLR